MSCNSGDSKLDAAVNSWLKYDKNLTTRQEVLDDIAASRWEKLRKTMLSRMSFGTAGLRGRMAAGYKCMNDVVILQTAQGLCSYVQKVCNQSQLQNGIVVGYDGRYNSKRFAELTAKVFVSSSIPVHLFSTVCPTPFIAFGTIYFGAAAGVMVTASHNPKEDNGYKVYWSNGSQIVSPHDVHILEEILTCLDIPDEHWDIDEIRSHNLVRHCYQDVTTEYMKYIHDCLHSDVLSQNKSACISTVYTAMHGVGYEYILKAFEAANLKAPISVMEQQDPNPDFPTVKFPNPEEPECLELGQKLAEQRGVKLLIANDPDADRLAVAEYDDSSKSWKVFSGNEMGALLGWWLLKQYYARHPTASASEVYVLASIVSSKMLRAIAKGKGEFVETLTGFKWMGNVTLLLQQQNKTAIFAFEEAIGYMCDPRVPDKDGVSAAVHVASLASHLYSKGSTLQQQLSDLYKEFGYHVSHNSYYICHDSAIIQKIFRRIRNYHGPGLYPTKVGSSEITYINDFTAGVKIPEDSTEGAHLSLTWLGFVINNPHLASVVIMPNIPHCTNIFCERGLCPAVGSYRLLLYLLEYIDVLGTGLDQDYTSGEMVLFRTSAGLLVTVRTSGTEPKLKYYTELVGDAHTHSEQEALKNKLEAMVQEFIEELLQPEENGLIPQA